MAGNIMVFDPIGGGKRILHDNPLTIGEWLTLELREWPPATALEIDCQRDKIPHACKGWPIASLVRGYGLKITSNNSGNPLFVELDIAVPEL